MTEMRIAHDILVGKSEGEGDHLGDEDVDGG
jgi:hypothetical protein